MKTKILVILIILIGLGVGGFFVYKNIFVPKFSPIEAGKGRVIFNLEVPDKITTRKIVDNFLIGVGTTDPEGTDHIRTVLNDLRIGGINYFLPAPTWGLIEEKEEGSYIWVPWLENLVHWADETGAVQNGHMLIFFHDQPYLIPEFAIDRPFDEQKEMLKNFIKATVSHFPEIEIWTLNEPIAQNFLGWSREQNYDVFVSASKWIHEINSEAKVMINMIPINVNWGGLDYEPREVMDDLIDRGLEADIIGIELYYWWAEEVDENGYPTLDWVKSRVDIFRKYNLPIIFSEIGVPGVMERKEQFDEQADWMEAFFRFFHDDEDVIGITWYFVRDDPFMPYAGLTNDDYTYRPVGERLMELANEWNPLTIHNLNGQKYLDLDPGEYDVIVNQQVFRVSIVEGQVVRIF